MEPINVYVVWRDDDVDTCYLQIGHLHRKLQDLSRAEDVNIERVP